MKIINKNKWKPLYQYSDVEGESYMIFARKGYNGLIDFKTKKIIGKIYGNSRLRIEIDTQKVFEELVNENYGDTNAR